MVGRNICWTNHGGLTLWHVKHHRQHEQNKSKSWETIQEGELSHFSADRSMVGWLRYVKNRIVEFTMFALLS